jgi:predicted deacetylase
LRLDDNFKRLVTQLGNAINDSLADSKRIADIIEEIRESGYDLFLVLEVTIGFNKRGEEKVVHSQKFASDQSHEAEFRLTNQDTQFLRALKIRVEEDRK